MMKDQQKAKVGARLKRIEGQVREIERMVDEDCYCMGILTQTRSIFAALRTVEDLIMENRMNTCVFDAMRSGSDSERQDKVDELMTVLSQFRKHS